MANSVSSFIRKSNTFLSGVTLYKAEILCNIWEICEQFGKDLGSRTLVSLRDAFKYCYMMISCLLLRYVMQMEITRPQQLPTMRI